MKRRGDLQAFRLFILDMSVRSEFIPKSCIKGVSAGLARCSESKGLDMKRGQLDPV